MTIIIILKQLNNTENYMFVLRFKKIFIFIYESFALFKFSLNWYFNCIANGKYKHNLIYKITDLNYHP